jgi:predicted transcriptional regulator
MVEVTLQKHGALCYIYAMTAKVLQEVMQRVEAWPEAAQAELAEIALEIDAGLRAGTYHATPKELEGIDRGLRTAREGRFATDDQVRGIFEKYRPA